jgi:UDP-glucuronate 4-epimerase
VRALVTGCAGFIGSHLTESLLDRGDSVVGIDCFNDNYGRAQKLANLSEVRDRDAFQFVPVDLARGDLTDLTEGCDVDYHLAAEPGVRSGWGPRYEHFVRNNLLGTQQLLEALKEQAGVRLVHASSSSVYGDSAPLPTPEEAPTAPVSPYGQTKLAAEHLCAVYAAAYEIDWRCLRYFTVYGPRQRPDMAVHRFMRATLEKRPITVFGDGEQTREFTYVGDVVAATLAAAEGDASGERVFNVGGGMPVSVNEVIGLVAQISGDRPRVQRLPAEAGEVSGTAANTSRARKHLGFAPSMPLDAGLAAQFDWASGLTPAATSAG